MLVLDASVVAEMVFASEAGRRLAGQILSSRESLHAPHLLDAEVAQVVRRHWLAGAVSPERGAEMLSDLSALRIRRHIHTPLLARVWELRGTLTAYDALYVALAEALDAELLTRDRRLASAPGVRARVVLV